MSRKAVLLGVASSIAMISVPAVAQDTGSTEASTGDSIVVTGSRIARSGYDAPTPVTAISTDDLVAKAPNSLSEALNQLPSFADSVNAIQESGTQPGQIRTGSYLNLRALGTERVLVLLDGQRLAPSSTNGSVDSSLIPELLVERVEVVTGGASAVYGSDAVSGVVNFILDDDFEGLKFRAQAGTVTEGYGENYRIGVAGGTSLLDDRLHIVASAERYHMNAIEKTDLPFYDERITQAGSGTVDDPYFAEYGAVFGALTDKGRAFPPPPLGGGPGFAGMEFNADGTLVPYDAATSISWTSGECCTAVASQETNQFYFGSTLEFSPGFSAYAKASYNTAHYEDNNIPGLRPPSVRIYRENAFLAPSSVDLLDTNGQTSFRMGKIFYTEGGLPTVKEGESLYLNGGFEGYFGDSFTWSIGYTHHETEQSTSTTDFRQANFYAAVDAVDEGQFLDGTPNGNTVCRVQLTNPGLYPDCVPINMFGAGSASAAAYDYVTDRSIGIVTNKMDSVQALLSGELFQMAGGAAAFAVGAEWRTQSLAIETNGDPANTIDTTGLRGVTSELTFQWLNQASGDGEYDVSEVFGELDLPIMDNDALGAFTINAAARLTDYSTSGTVTTWKIGGVYDPVPGARIRATLSRDIRAPNLYELFAGQTEQLARIDNPLDPSAPELFPRTISGGNPDLVPEKADTLTVGVVLDPAPGLTLALDYWSIATSDAIGAPFSNIEIVNTCYSSGLTSPLCEFITFDGDGLPTAIEINNQNLASQDVSGLDFEATYSFDALGGVLRLNTRGTRMISFEQVSFEGQPAEEFVGTGDWVSTPLPKWRFTADARWTSGPLTLSVQTRYIGAFEVSNRNVWVDNDVDSVVYTDISAAYDLDVFGGNVQLFATGTNVFDTDFPIVPVGTIPGGSPPTYRNTYSIFGPQVTVGIRGTF